MMAGRGPNRSTYLALAIIFFCVVYWVSKSSTYSPAFEESNLDVGSTHSHDALNQYEDTKVQSHADSHTTTEFSHDDILEEPVDDEKLLVLQKSSQYPAQFPRLIWQTASEEGREKWAAKSETWQKVKGFQYNFLNDDDATEFVHANFNETQASVVQFWDSLSTPVLRADFLRYLIMLAKGGIYGDIDTSVLSHPDGWIPIPLGAQEINAIIGIEYDDHTYPMFVRPISFCQWTLMSKPGHPIFQLAVQRVMSNLEFLARRQRMTLSNLTLQKADVLEATGPGMISDVVMQVIRDQGYDVTWETFHGQKEAKLFGDVLILPINGFAGSQKHSHAGNPEYGDKFVAHHFGKSWYKGKNDPIGGSSSKIKGEKQKSKSETEKQGSTATKKLKEEGSTKKESAQELKKAKDSAREMMTKEGMLQEDQPTGQKVEENE